jgi:D-3-phosphoglycerate dehydrogenase / 2-oxoglutarate reductase
MLATSPLSDPVSGHVVAVDARYYRNEDLPTERAAWEARGLRLTLGAAQSEDDIIALAQDADVIAYMGLYTPFTARVIESLPHCRLIARYGIGMETVDLDAATRQGILVCNAAEYCVPEVADHAVALMLNMARRITYFDRNVRRGRWADALTDTLPLRRMSALTVGLVGFGRIARRVATLMRPMVGRIIAYDPYVDPAMAAKIGVELAPLDTLLAESDFVSVHTPLMAGTRGLIGAAQLDKMRPTAYLINTSRGPVVDEAALTAALQAGRIAGAGLDVFEVEPLAADSPLRTLENAVLVPHIAANSVESVQDLIQSVVHTVLDVMTGRWPAHVMNPTVIPRMPLEKVYST